MEKLKFFIEENNFLKTWTKYNMRIIKHKDYLTYYPYVVQELNEFDGESWEDIESFHTLKEAKHYININT